MKRILWIVVGLGILGAGLFYLATTENVETYVTPKIERIEVEKEVEVPTLEKRVKDALEANSEAIEAKAQAAYDAAKTQAEKQIELEVTQAYQSEIDARATELEKEVGVY